MPLILKGVIVAVLAATAADVHWIVCSSSDGKEVLASVLRLFTFSKSSRSLRPLNMDGSIPVIWFYARSNLRY
jgi:hypothetical protein